MHNLKNFQRLNRKIRPRMNHWWIRKKTFRKNPIHKKGKTVKINVNMPKLNTKPIAKKRIVFHTPQNHSLFALHQIDFKNCQSV